MNHRKISKHPIVREEKKLESKTTFDSTRSILIQCDKKSFAIFRFPEASSKLAIHEKDMRQILSERGIERRARKRGQSGFKMNTNHLFSLKHLKLGIRVECVRDGSEKVLIDERIRSVPAYKPIRVINK